MPTPSIRRLCVAAPTHQALKVLAEKCGGNDRLHFYTLAALLGDAGGAMADLLARPFAGLGRWLTQKDDRRLVRLSPVIGLVSGTVFRWIVDSLIARGGA